MKIILLSLLSVSLLAGCVTTPGHIQTRKSVFDQSTEISMTPAWILDGLGGFRVGLHRSSKMPTNDLVLTVLVMDAVNIASGPSLKFNLDGEIVSISPLDSLTSIDYQPGTFRNESSRRYPVTVDFVHRLISASNCTARLDLSRDYLEGRFSTDAPTSARPAFRRFLTNIGHPVGGVMPSPSTSTRSPKGS